MIGLFTRLMMVAQLIEESGCSREEAEKIADREIERRLAAMARQEEPPKPNVEYESRWLQ